MIRQTRTVSPLSFYDIQLHQQKRQIIDWQKKYSYLLKNPSEALLNITSEELEEKKREVFYLMFLERGIIRTFEEKKLELLSELDNIIPWWVFIPKNNPVVGSSRHDVLKNYIKVLGLENGFEVKDEHNIHDPVLNRRFVIDVVLEKNGVRVAVECGQCPKEKLKRLQTLFDSVVHFTYSDYYFVNKIRDKMRPIFEARNPELNDV